MLADFRPSEREPIRRRAAEPKKGANILGSPGSAVRCFYRDDRLPGRERIVYGDPRDLLRTPDEIRECVCFLGTEDSRGRVKLGGTVALVTVRLGRLDRFAAYLVTARHCIRKASESGDKPVLRVNTRDGGVQILDISPLTWNYPENDAADLAVSELIGDAFFDGLILGSLDVSMLLTQEDAERVQLGIGEELICTGLFYRRQGGGRNIPIVRFGNIAAMPEEPLIDEDTGLEYDAFLAEIRSIGGLSGSPVFARLQPGRKDAEGAVISTTPQWFWLGVIRGHWRSWEFVAADVTGDESKMLNLGIALVTPAWEALEVLNGEDYVKERKEAERQIRKAEAPTKDAVVGDDEFERFEDLTRKLVNVPKKEIDEKRREGF